MRLCACVRELRILCSDEEGSECREAKGNRVSVNESRVSELWKREDSKLREVARERKESELRIASLAVKNIV